MFDIKDILKTAGDAVANSQLNNLKKGVPNVYSRNGQLYFQLPDGRITEEVPEILQNAYQQSQAFKTR